MLAVFSVLGVLVYHTDTHRYRQQFKAHVRCPHTGTSLRRPLFKHTAPRVLTSCKELPITGFPVAVVETGARTPIPNMQSKRLIHWEASARRPYHSEHPNSSELRSCVKVEVAVPNKSTVSVDVKQHFDSTPADREVCPCCGLRQRQQDTA